MPVNVDIADIKGPEGERVRRLYAVPAGTAAPKKARESFEKRAAPARRRMSERKREYARTQKNATAGRRARNSTIRRGFRHTARIGRGVHRAAGSPAGTVAAMIGLFVGGGIVVALVKNPQIITAPLNFIAAAVKAFTGLLGGTGPTKTSAPVQNVAPKL